jgi:predicted glycosyltransferase
LKILFSLNHPAHFHLLRNAMKNLKERGNEVIIVNKKKDILDELLDESGMVHYNILPEGRKDSRTGILLGLMKRDIRLIRLCRELKPDLMAGTSVETAQTGWFLNIPSINLNEDDYTAVPLYARMSYPFSSCILAPDTCPTGKWERKTIHYNGYHELAYLHPNHFTPDKNIAAKYVNVDSPYFLIRFARLGAHHDKGISGISDDIALELIKLLESCGNIYISSERAFTGQLEKYRLAIRVSDIHHIMAFAQMFIGDSQTMAAEAGVLGVPFIRFNDFVGRLGYLDELEKQYKLGTGIRTENSAQLIPAVKQMLNSIAGTGGYKEKRERLIHEKIDLAQFLTWFIHNYPESKVRMKNEPDYQKRFFLS